MLQPIKVSIQTQITVVDLNIFYCQIYTIGFNTSFTTYMKFSPDNVVVNRYILSDCRSDPWFWIVGDTCMFIGIYCRIADQIHGFRLLVILVCFIIGFIGVFGWSSILTFLIVIVLSFLYFRWYRSSLLLVILMFYIDVFELSVISAIFHCWT